MITFATGCSGIGAPEVAWGDRIGWKCLWCSEIEPFPCAVLKYRWTDVPNVGDFLTIADRIDKDELEAPDVYIAGTPCQAFSVAGLRKSLKDERGNLTLEYCKIANAMDAQRRRRGLPETIFVWENVPGVFSTEDNAFGYFLGAMLGLDSDVSPQDGQWEYYGSFVAYRAVAWRVLDAQYFGVAQRRRRVFVVGTARAGFSPARGLFEFGRVSRLAPPSREARARTAAYAENHIGTASAIRMRSGCEGGGKGALVADELSNTLQTGNDQSICCYGIRNGQPAEACDMQKEVSQTLNCMHDSQAVMCVPINSMIIGKDVTDRQTTGIGEDGEPAPTLQAGHHHAVAVSQYGEVAGALSARFDSSPCADRGQTVVTCYEFNPTDTRVKETEISPTVLSRWGTVGNQIPLAASCGFARRLTTVECARLQGFPDHHTEIPWRGKPAEKCPRAPQYKAYGNSMCVNVIEWIGRQIENELNNPQPLTIYQPEQMEFDF